MNYKTHPQSKDVPSRKQRKGLRNSVFIANRSMKAKQIKQRRTDARG